MTTIPPTPPELLDGRTVHPVGDTITSLPYQSPWMSGRGAALITICALRLETDGSVSACLADERNTPYRDEGALVWHPLAEFYDEWPD